MESHSGIVNETPTDTSSRAATSISSLSAEATAAVSSLTFRALGGSYHGAGRSPRVAKRLEGRAVRFDTQL